MSECEFLEGKGAALFEDGDEAAEVGRVHVGLQGGLVLPGLDDFDMVVGAEAAEGLVRNAAGIVEREFDELDGGVDGFLSERAVCNFKKTVQAYHNSVKIAIRFILHEPQRCFDIFFLRSDIIAGIFAFAQVIRAPI